MPAEVHGWFLLNSIAVNYFLWSFQVQRVPGSQGDLLREEDSRCCFYFIQRGKFFHGRGQFMPFQNHFCSWENESWKIASIVI